MTRRLTFALALALLMATLSFAQTRGGFGRYAHFAPGYEGSHSSFAHRRPAYPRGYYLGDLVFYYDDYPFGPAATPELGPQVIVMQAPVEAEASSQRKATPLLIELEGDRYVRYGGVTLSTDRNPPAGGQAERELRTSDDSATAVSTRRLYSGKAQSDVREARPAPDETGPDQLAPTVLVYRDGHREQVSDYAIVGRVLYAHQSNDDQPGYGMRSIELSALDLPATMKANRENGVNFILPAGPHEVVTRP